MTGELIATADLLEPGRWAADALEQHRRMFRIRLFEEKAADLYREGAIPGFLHTSVGQEATAVGACWPLGAADAVVSTHRGHGHCLAKGAAPAGMLAELMGRATGTCGGYGGSMHIADISTGTFGANGIVGAGLPIANGIAHARRQAGVDAAVVAFFGDGAVATGAFHEALNLAALWRLGVLFVCENNQFAEFTSAAAQHLVAPAKRAEAYGVESAQVDGNDVAEVVACCTSYVERLRSGEGPFFVEALTYRRRGHYEGDPAGYRDRASHEAWEGKDPLARSAARLDAAGLAGDRTLVEAEVADELEAAVTLARSAPEPSVPGRPALISRRPAAPEPSADHGEGVFRAMDAVREALAYELARDRRVWVAGIDVAAGGGVFGVTKGLAEQFPGRVLDTPIAESAIIGLAVGAAMAGTRPVVEIMYMDFLAVCLDQLVNQAAKLPYMTGGQVEVPLVVRTQTGAGRSSAAQHSQSLEAVLAHVPGLVVVMPSTPADTYGLLRAAIADPNPVLFVEHRYLYGRKGPRPPVDHVVPLGKAVVRRPGEQVTVVSWSKTVAHCLEAAEIAAAQGVSAEVVDLRTITPLDTDAIEASVDKTGRLLVVHEAVERGGFGAEVAARIADVRFWSLDAPIRRLGASFTPMPYAPRLERACLPDAARISEAIVSLGKV